MDELGERRRRTTARLERLERALRQWDAYEASKRTAAESMKLDQQVRRPSLSRSALQELRRTLIDLLRELEAVWERRN